MRSQITKYKNEKSVAVALASLVSLTVLPSIHASSGYRTVTVQKGDSLSVIAKRELGCGCPNHVAKVARASGIRNPDRIKVGQKIQIPTSGGKKSGSLRGKGNYYAVRSGDSMTSIAQAVYGKASMWRAIQHANPRVSPKRLRVGSKLVIPEKALATRLCLNVGPVSACYGTNGFSVSAGPTLNFGWGSISLEQDIL